MKYQTELGTIGIPTFSLTKSTKRDLMNVQCDLMNVQCDLMNVQCDFGILQNKYFSYLSKFI